MEDQPTGESADTAGSNLTVATPSRKRRHVELDESVEDDDGMQCSVCLDKWTSAGKHRLCSLKCGHLYGKSCIMRWLSDGKFTCPQCNAPCSRSDIRYIYAKKLVVADTDELEDMRIKYEKLLSETAQIRTQLKMYECLTSSLRAEVRKITMLKTTTATKTHSFQTKLVRSDVLTDGNCRVLSYCKQRNQIAIAREQQGPLWPGFGVVYLTATDTLSSFNMFHKGEIRDLAFHPTKPTHLLTVSFDMDVKVTSTTEHKVVFKWTSKHRLWSCCWDAQFSDIAYVGTERGEVIKLCTSDDQNPSEEYLALPEKQIKPVAVLSLFSSRKLDTLLCCRLLSMTAYTTVNGVSQVQLLDLGRYSAMTVNESGPDVLMILACKPDADSKYFRHICYKLELNENSDGINLTKQHVINCTWLQNILSRPCLFVWPAFTLYFAYDDASASVCGWLIREEGISKVTTVQMGPKAGAARDMCVVEKNDKLLLHVLSTDVFRTYEIEPSEKS